METPSTFLTNEEKGSSKVLTQSSNTTTESPNASSKPMKMANDKSSTSDDTFASYQAARAHFVHIVKPPAIVSHDGKKKLMAGENRSNQGVSSDAHHAESRVTEIQSGTKESDSGIEAE
eukprot:g3284.t1